MASPSSPQIDAAIQTLFDVAFTNQPAINAQLHAFADILLGNAPAVFDSTNWDEVNWDDAGGPPSQLLPWNVGAVVFTADQQAQIKAQIAAVRARFKEAESYLLMMEAAAGV